MNQCPNCEEGKIVEKESAASVFLLQQKETFEICANCAHIQNAPNGGKLQCDECGEESEYSINTSSAGSLGASRQKVIAICLNCEGTQEIFQL